MKQKVMVVDDSPMIRNIIQNELKNDYEVAAFSSAEDALSQIVDINPELILMDINLPGMNGITAVEEIKKRDESKNIPIIMLTNQKESKNLIKAYAAGADDYLLKDLTVKEVKNKIKTFLENLEKE